MFPAIFAISDMLFYIVAEMALLAEGFEIRPGIIGFVVIHVRDCEHDLCLLLNSFTLYVDVILYAADLAVVTCFQAHLLRYLVPEWVIFFVVYRHGYMIVNCSPSPGIL